MVSTGIRVAAPEYGVDELQTRVKLAVSTASFAAG